MPWRPRWLARAVRPVPPRRATICARKTSPPPVTYGQKAFMVGRSTRPSVNSHRASRRCGSEASATWSAATGCDRPRPRRGRARRAARNGRLVDIHSAVERADRSSWSDRPNAATGRGPPGDRPPADKTTRTPLRLSFCSFFASRSPVWAATRPPRPPDPRHTRFRTWAGATDPMAFPASRLRESRGVRRRSRVARVPGLRVAGRPAAASADGPNCR